MHGFRTCRGGDQNEFWVIKSIHWDRFFGANGIILSAAGNVTSLFPYLQH